MRSLASSTGSSKEVSRRKGLTTLLFLLAGSVLWPGEALSESIPRPLLQIPLAHDSAGVESDSLQIEPGPVTEAETIDPLSPEPLLIPLKPDCGGEWDSALETLPVEQRGWVRSINHRVFHVRVEDQVIARLELLSAVSPDACDLSADWSLRRNTLLVSYFPVDGEVEEVQYDISPDDDFMAETLEVQASKGSVALVGSNPEGELLMLELDLIRLRSIYSDVVEDVPARRRVLTV